MEKKTNLPSESFRKPGLWETLKEAFLGVRRPFDCIQVEVSSRCPGRCTYCPRTTRNDVWLSRDMDIDTFGRIWPLMRRSGRVHLQGWGEPLLNPGFFEMVALARRADCAVSTTSCGLRMDEEIALKLVESGIDIIAFSLTGTDPESNAARRGIGFDRVCETIATLQRVRKHRMGVHLEIRFAYLMLASNMEAVRGLPELMQRLGVHAAVVSTLDHIPAPALESEAILPKDAEKIARAATILAETAAEARRRDLGFHYALPRPDASGACCRENIDRTLFVSADGDVSPCVYVNVPVGIPDPGRRIFGNIKREDLIEIWEGEPFRRFRERLSQGDPDLPCRSCPKRFMA